MSGSAGDVESSAGVLRSFRHGRQPEVAADGTNPRRDDELVAFFALTMLTSSVLRLPAVLTGADIGQGWP